MTANKGLTARLRRALKRLLLVIDRYRVTAAERIFLRNVRDSVPRCDSNGPVVLLEAVEDHYYLVLFACIVSRLSAEQSIDVQQFLPRSLRPGFSRSWLHAVKSLMFYNRLTDRKWMRLYSSFCRCVAYRSSASLLSRSSLADLVEARRIWKNLTSGEMLEELTIAGIKVGDLIYDSYLRFKPAETVDLRSAYLWLVIWQTLRDLRQARAYMLNVRPRMFLATFSTYIQHGVAVRVALAAGIEVFTFGNHQEFYKQLKSTDWVHTRNPDGYRSGFARLEDPAPKLEEAERALSARLAGGIDAATAYMKRSAYAGTAELPEGIQGSLLVFLHDFFDSPHCYRGMIFPDFWEWATFTLSLARRAGIKVFVKPHPNQIESSEPVVQRLMAEYPETTCLSIDTSNARLAEAGVACAITVYGTISHEMAYLGVPSIAAGHNPHISFSFCHTARDRDEYARLILNHRSLLHSPEKLRRESLEFYYMHNLKNAEEAPLRDALIRFRARLISQNGLLNSGADFLSFAAGIDASAGFRKACGDLAARLAGRDDALRNPGPLVRERASAV